MYPAVSTTAAAAPTASGDVVVECGQDHDTSATNPTGRAGPIDPKKIRNVTAA
jgi:hypothetical protein